MPFLLEIRCETPAALGKEDEIAAAMARLGGSLDIRETADGPGTGSVCLTYEFEDIEAAEVAAAALRGCGHQVEGPASYGG